MNQRAIIVAAGMGRRLAPYTDDRPKCLVEVNGKSILERQIEAYRAAGVDEICVVRGYRSGDIRIPGLRYFENPGFQRNNILVSLFHAEPATTHAQLRALLKEAPTSSNLCARGSVKATVIPVTQLRSNVCAARVRSSSEKRIATNLQWVHRRRTPVFS